MSTRSDSLRKGLIHILAGGGLYSGADLARRLNISRTAIWKHIRHMRTCGLVIESVRGRGYQLRQTVGLLQAKTIRSLLSPAVTGRVSSLQVLFETTSTNDVLSENYGRAALHGHVLLAEYQSQGRGRRGNVWISPLAGSINLSLGWHYDMPPQHPGCLSLAIAVGVMRVFGQHGIAGAGLKWPNDIFANGRKLGGILVEMRGENAGPVDVIVGIGININSAVAIRLADHEVTDIQALTGRPPSRNRLAASLINELVMMLERYPELEIGSLLQEWRGYDCAQGRNATIHLPDRTCSGRVIGVDDQGLLQMSIDNELQTFTSGQISFAVQN